MFLIFSGSDFVPRTVLTFVLFSIPHSFAMISQIVMFIYRIL